MIKAAIFVPPVARRLSSRSMLRAEAIRNTLKTARSAAIRISFTSSFLALTKRPASGPRLNEQPPSMQL